jgi:hypothetical protein
VKTLILKFLLGRGIGKLQEIVSKMIRHGATTAGGYLVGVEYASTGDIASAEGALLTLAGLGLSVARSYASAQLGSK